MCTPGCGRSCPQARREAAAATMFIRLGSLIVVAAKHRDDGAALTYFAVNLKSNLIASRSSSARTESI